ncbi:MAG: hypothetical protein Q9172_002047 [Xanthocarpia lactea]
MSAPAKAPIPKDAATGLSREQKLQGILAQIDGNNDDMLQPIRNDEQLRDLYSLRQQLGLKIKEEAEKVPMDWDKLDPLIAEFLEKDGTIMSKLLQTKQVECEPPARGPPPEPLERGPPTEPLQGPVIYSQFGSTK